MPVVPGQPGGAPLPPAPDTARNVCTNALYEINVVAPGEIPEAQELAFVLNKFNQLLDSWSTQKVYIYALQLLSASNVTPFAPFLLIPGLSPHTIGPAPIAAAPAPTFLVNGERPVRIANANVILNTTNPTVRVPLHIRDKDWWAGQTVQTIQTSLPTDLYYRPDWPLGSLFFWPVPNQGYGAEIEVETFLNGS